MSISEEISRLSGNIANAYAAVEDLGGTVPQNTNSDNLADSIRSIQNNVDVVSGADAFTETNGTMSTNYSFLVKRFGITYLQFYVTANSAGSLVIVGKIKQTKYYPYQKSLLFAAFDETGRSIVECTINANNGNIGIYNAQTNHGYVVALSYISSL